MVWTERAFSLPKEAAIHCLRQEGRLFFNIRTIRHNIIVTFVFHGFYLIK